MVNDEKKEFLTADQQLIEWLLFKTKVKLTDISKATGVTTSSLGSLRRKESDIQEIRFRTAAALTKYAIELKKELQL